jgi:hypothetical protein
MKSINHYIRNLWNGFASIFLSRWDLVVGQQIYVIWFYINKFLVEAMQQYISPALGAIFGMLFLEGHTMCIAAWYTLKKYRKDPQVYGLNQWNETNCRYRPVLLLHGAVGSWSYLGDLAVALKNANIPVFVIDLGFGLPTEKMRKKIFNKIKEIRRLYYNFNQKSDDESYSNQIGRQSLCTTQEEMSTVKLIRTSQESETTRVPTNLTNLHNIPLVDIVAHSNGGNVALYSTFTENCSYIDGEGNFKFRCEPQANPHIGKVITVALPSNQTETNWMREINKINDLFNVNAKFDALMDYKRCALVEELHSHVEYIDAGHIGIVFKSSTYNRVLQFLLK